MSFCAETVRQAVLAASLHRDDMHEYQDGQGGTVDFMKKNPFSALFVDLGLGKTASALTAILDLACNMEIERTLVIGPLRVVKQTWSDEIENWSHLAGLTYSFIRDDELTDAINAAGARARKDLLEGMSNSRVNDTIMKLRLRDVRKKTRSQRLGGGLTASESKALYHKNVAEAEALPINPKEKKLYVEYQRYRATKRAVRWHMERNPATIYAINREMVKFLVDAWGPEDWPYDCVVIDESSALKDHSTKRFNAMVKVLPRIKRMHQLTATPAAETYLHLYAQMYLLDKGERLGRTFSEYREEYFNHNKYNYTYTLKKGAEEVIAGKLADICLTLKAEDYLPMEEPVPINRYVDLTPEQMDLYEQMQNNSVVEFNGRIIEADTAASLSNKLLQMASGMLYETAWEEDPIDDDLDMTKVKRIHDLHTLKIDELVEFMEEVGDECVMVAYHYKASLDRLQKAFPYAVKMDREGKVIKPWNQKKIRMLLIHPMSAGHGLNLQKGGRHVVFYDIPWSLELYLQLIGRLARQGQEKIVYVTHLDARGTIDELVVACLVAKRSAQDNFFRLLKRLRKALAA